MTTSDSREELARRLTELRGLPGFPNASDEAILTASLPPAYTASPNPFMEDWLETSSPAGDRNGHYEDPGPFTTDVSVGKGNLFYKAHSFPTKVPHPAIMRYILHYTRPGDVVLDGFCGSGMAGLAAQACGDPDPQTRREIAAEMGDVQWGARRAVLQDLSPSATFIAAGMNLPVDAMAFDRRSREILDAFDAKWGWMYQTAHIDGRTARIDYTVWSEVFTCPSCGNEVVFYQVAFDKETGKVRDSFRCRSCGRELSKKSLERRKARVRTLAGDTIDRIEFRPVAIHYRLGKAKYEKVPDEGDIAVLRRIASLHLPGPVPTVRFPLEDMYHGSRLGPKGFTHVHHMWSDRALVALSVLWGECSTEVDPTLRLALIFWIEQAFWGLSWMNRHKTLQFGRVGGSAVNNYLSGVYYVPSLSAECSVRYNLEGSRPTSGKRASLVKTWMASPAKQDAVRISTASSTAVGLPDSSVDYVFVDPPFGSNIYYADLGYLVEAWHGIVQNAAEEAIVNQSKQQTRSLDEYQDLMKDCFREFHRVLKPGRWMTVEFSNSSNEVWLAIQGALAGAGFVVADTTVFDKEQLSYRQVTAKNAVKRDLIISVYKPDKAVQDKVSVVGGSEEGLWAFVREHLEKLPRYEGKRGRVGPVRERFSDRLYDRALGYHIHRNVSFPLTAAQFYDGLDQRFTVRGGMYFLSYQVEEYERALMTVKELAQAGLFITNETTAVQWLRQQLKSKPRTYAEIQPPFFTELQAGLPDWEELPNLRQLLEVTFVQDSQDRWYVPDPKKAEDMEKVRQRSLLREFEQYTASRGKLTKFRTVSLQTGFKDAWDRRDFARIVAVGHRLPDELFAEEPGLFQYLKVAEAQTRR